MKAIKDLVRESTNRPGAKLWMARLLQVDAAAGLTKYLRANGVRVEPYDERTDDWKYQS